MLKNIHMIDEEWKSFCLNVSVYLTDYSTNLFLDKYSINVMSNKDQDENCWGMLVDLEGYGRHGDSKHDYKTITYTDSKKTYKDYMHASHGMLYARTDEILWKLYPLKAAILVRTFKHILSLTCNQINIYIIYVVGVVLNCLQKLHRCLNE